MVGPIRIHGQNRSRRNISCFYFKILYMPKRRWNHNIWHMPITIFLLRKIYCTNNILCVCSVIVFGWPTCISHIVLCNSRKLVKHNMLSGMPFTTPTNYDNKKYTIVYVLLAHLMLIGVWIDILYLCDSSFTLTNHRHWNVLWNMSSKRDIMGSQS